MALCCQQMLSFISILCRYYCSLTLDHTENEHSRRSKKHLTFHFPKEKKSPAYVTPADNTEGVSLSWLFAHQGDTQSNK